MTTKNLWKYIETHIYENAIQDYERAIYRLDIAKKHSFNVTRLKGEMVGLFGDLKPQWDYKAVADYLQLRLNLASSMQHRTRMTLRLRLIKTASLNLDDARECITDFQLRISEQAQRQLRKAWQKAQES
jgi:hypothetical protein